MNKFKFGDKVWHEKYGLCVITRSEPLRLYSIAHNHPAIAQIPWLISESELAPASDWVKCSERMPDCDGRYLVMCNFGDSQYEQVYFFNSDRNEFSCIFSNERITHWMPLPTPPMEISND